MRTIDGHAHLYGGVEGIPALAETARALGFARMNIACIPSAKSVNTNPPGLAAKARYPELFYFFAGLDHAEHFTGGAVKSPPLAEQAERLAALGADGFKLLEAKPTSRKWLGLPVDGPYFAEFFARAEKLGLPLLWHTADPEEFWEPARTPAWAVSRGWAYDASFLPKEAHYAEVERVLDRHPGLKVILPHFYFLSADLPRAERLLARFPNVCFDLAPGVELIYNLSRDPAAAREFFIRHAGRIVFGTDIGILPDMTPRQSERRAGLVLRFLSTGDEFGADPEADFLLEPPPGAVGRGLDLPVGVLEKILAGNFGRLAGRAPRPLDRKLAREECLRLAKSFDALPGEKSAALHPARAADLLGR
jgi:predicted TIM-barrel fold metal-dependent hydrolase